MKTLRLAMLVAVGIGTIAIILGFVNFAQYAARAEQPADPRAEGIVVLTGGSDRIDSGLQLLAEGRATRLLISGANPAFTKRTLTRSFGGDFGLALTCCVDVGHAARDTIGNAVEARRWAETQHFDSLLVVTSDYHMRRSMAELADAMPNVQLLAVPISNPDLHLADWWRDPGTFTLLAREYGKYLLTVARLTFTTTATSSVADAAQR